MSSTASIDAVRTERLLCVRPTADHDAAILEHLRDPRVARTLSANGEPPTEAEVAANLLVKQAHWRRYGFGLWTLLDRTSGEFVGRGGLQHTSVTGTDEVEVGWSIVPERWQQGLGTELALASVTAGFETLRLDELIAYTRTDNVASRRLMDKAGFTYERELAHPVCPHLLYRRSRC